jgi:DNA-binding transcriptional ArsR family regulator
MHPVHQTFAALADPNRTRIVALLLQGERPVGEVAKKLRLSQPSASKHLKTLKDAGLVAVRSDAQSRVYSLRPAALRSLDAWLTPYRKLWADRLDALERHLGAMPPSRTGKGKER